MFVCLRRLDRDLIKKCIFVSCKVLVILDVLMKLEFLEMSSKKNQIPNFTKIPPVGAELFRRVDGRSYRHDGANSRVSHLCERA